MSITLAGHKMIYDTYLREKAKEDKNSQAITNTSIITKTDEKIAEEVGLSSERVKKIILLLGN